MLGASLVGLCTMFLAVNSSDDPSRYEFRQMHMGSEFKIVLYTTREAEARSASDSAFALCGRL